MCTATAKDSHEWRAARDEKIASPDWKIERLKYFETPFVHARHWRVMRRNMSKREWKRRGLAEDVRPENGIYWGFDKETQVVPLPIGARDITAQVIRRIAPRGNYSMLIGNDPGRAKHVAVYLKAYQLERFGDPVWFVVGELIKERVVAAGFAASVRSDLQERFGIQYEGGEQAFVVTDKWVDAEKSEKRDKTVLTAWRNAGFRVRPAAWQKNPPPGKAPGPGSVPVESSIEVINSLSAPVEGPTRFFVLGENKKQICDPVAPELVESLENAQRGPDGSADRYFKDKKSKDKSDLPSATRHALWPFEKLRADYGRGESAAA